MENRVEPETKRYLLDAALVFQIVGFGQIRAD